MGILAPLLTLVALLAVPCHAGQSSSAAAEPATLVEVRGTRAVISAGQALGVLSGAYYAVTRDGQRIARLRVTRASFDVADAVLTPEDPKRPAEAGDEVPLEPLPIQTTQPSPSSAGLGQSGSPTQADHRVATTPRVARGEGSPPSTGLRVAETGGPSTDESAAEDVVARLTEEGFENVVARPVPGGVSVAYENRRFRWEVAGLEQALEAIASVPGAQGILQLTAKSLNTPFFTLEVPLQSYRDYLAGSLSPQELRQQMTLSRSPGAAARGVGANPSWGRVDLTLGDGLRGRFLTTPQQHVRGYQHRLRPGLEVELSKGLRLQIREWVPIANKGYGMSPTPDRFALDYHRWLGKDVLAGLSAGTLQESVSGFRADLALFPVKGNTLLLSLGRVGKSVTDASLTTYNATLRTKLPLGDSYLVTRYGKWLEGHTGLQVGLATAFREREFGFYLNRSQGKNQLLLTLTLPLWGERYSMPRALRPRLERTFNYNYASIKPELSRMLADDPFTDSWQDLELRDRLPEYLAFLRPAPTEDAQPAASEPPKPGQPRKLSTVESGGRLQRKTAVVDDRDLLGASLYGTTGLLGIPAAEVLPRGYFAYNINFVDWKHRSGAIPGSRGTMSNELILGVLPNVEAVVQITNVEGKPWLQNTSRFPGGEHGWNMDRSVHAQWRLWGEKGAIPAVAIGWQDISVSGLGPGVSSTPQVGGAKYVVASKHLGKLGIHAGYGTDRLNGLFFGLDRPLLPWLRAIADYDTTYTNLGLRATFLKHLTADAYMNGSTGLGAALTYRLKL